MNEYTEVSRKALKQDRVAICPCFGCNIMKRVKPLKFGFFGFGRHPQCKVHRIPLVYLDEKFGDFVSGALACLFDKAGLPPKELISLVKERFPADLEAFVNAWVYSITIGRGAPIVSRYLDAITSAYMSNLTKKQVKTLKLDISNKRKLIKALKDNEAIIRGIKEMAHHYTRLLKHLRAHSEILVDIRELKPISEDLRRSLEAWQNVMAKEEQKLWDIKEKRDVPLTTVKSFYDESLNAGTCRCLLGLAPEKNKKRNITAFDRFSVYLDFWKEGLAIKFIDSDIQALKVIDNFRLNAADNSNKKIPGNDLPKTLNQTNQKKKIDLKSYAEKIIDEKALEIRNIREKLGVIRIHQSRIVKLKSIYTDKLNDPNKMYELGSAMGRRKLWWEGLTYKIKFLDNDDYVWGITTRTLNKRWFDYVKNSILNHQSHNFGIHRKIRDILIRENNKWKEIHGRSNFFDHSGKPIWKNIMGFLNGHFKREIHSIHFKIGDLRNSEIDLIDKHKNDPHMLNINPGGELPGHIKTIRDIDWKNVALECALGKSMKDIYERMINSN